MEAPVAAPVERGWGKLLLALAAFFLIPAIPQVRAVLPIDETLVIFVSAMGACALVGWWAGGRAWLAIAWVAAAVAVVLPQPATGTAFFNLARGWSLLLAGAFGLVCLCVPRQPLFTRAMVALTATLALAGVMSLLGPVSWAQASAVIGREYARRNAETMSMLNAFLASRPADWQKLVNKVPQLASVPAETDKELGQLANAGRMLFPALLALESLAGLALAWATYHRLGRTRLGAPLRPLREFRFNDQLVWGLIVGLTVLVLPTLAGARGVGGNLLLFFGALYAVRGLGVLAWFIAPQSLALTLTAGFLLLWAPFINVIVALGFIVLAVTALGLGLGDTWADWRKHVRPTL